MLKQIDRLAGWIGIAAIRGYQLLLAPMLIGGCRHTPSCSEYAAEAMSRHGALSGIRMTLRRLGRCRPGGTFGYDPVP
jgi:putative membrane protein insertion efficiency factor